MTRKHSRSPKEYLKRVYAKEAPPYKNYPYTFAATRVGGVAWFSQERYKELKKTLIAKEHLLIGS
jgi:hypothetical protein